MYSSAEVKPQARSDASGRAQRAARLPGTRRLETASNQALLRQRGDAPPLIGIQAESLQRKGLSSSPQIAPASVHDAIGTSGQPLDPAMRTFFGPRFGSDFSAVRVHHDSQAARSAQDVRALAYTVGNHIVFAPGQYAPSTPAGGRLLAHELAHVLQQGDQAPESTGRPTSLTRTGTPMLSRYTSDGTPTDVFEYIETVNKLFQDVEALKVVGALSAAEESEIAVALTDVEATNTILTAMADAEATVLAERQGMADFEGVMAEGGEGGGMGQEIMFVGVSTMPIATAFAPKTPEQIAAKTKADAAVTQAWRLMREVVAKHRGVPATQTSTQTATQASTQKQTQTRVRRPDLDSENVQGPCKARASAQRGGNTCHDLFATSVSGTTREWEVTTPQGLSTDFDAMVQGQQLFEIKTGYGYLLNNSPANVYRRMQTLARFLEQSETQSAIASACGYSLVWYFNDKHVAALVEGLIRPPVRYIPFPCNQDM